jgi:hypothetical protein
MNPIDDNFKAALRHAQRRLEQRGQQCDDRKIAMAWTELARSEPTTTVPTRSGLELEVRRELAGVNKVEYRGFLPNRQGQVAWMHCMAPLYGRVQVTNANVYEVHGKDYRRQGIGTAIYDLIEADVRGAGGEGVEPHWGSMSDEAIAFWQKRRPDYAEQIGKLNRLGPSIASGLFD